jgi:hypothetical protein
MKSTLTGTTRLTGLDEPPVSSIVGTSLVVKEQINLVYLPIYRAKVFTPGIRLNSTKNTSRRLSSTVKLK